MTDHKAGAAVPPLTIGGTVLYRWLLAERGRLAQRLVTQFGQEIGSYQRLPDQELLDRVASATEQNLVLIAESLRTRTITPAEALSGEITTSAARRAGEGFPLDAVMAAYSSGMLQVWRTMVEHAGPSDLADVVTCGELLLGYLYRSCTAVSAAYLRERRRVDSNGQQRRYALISALLRGDPLTGSSHAAGVQLPERYLVLALRFARHPDEDLAGAGGLMAAQRKAYRAGEELDRRCGEGTLALLDAGGGIALLPRSAEDDGAGTDALVASLAAAIEVEVVAGGVSAAPDQVPGAAGEAADLAELAATFGRGGGYYRITDLLLEYQLTRPSPARAELGRLLTPLDAHPDLLTTLRTYLRSGLNRRRTAATLHLHPNTVDYRIHKAAALTGLDPADPDQLQLIGAALIIRRNAVTS
jgi:hypothetical protein